MSTDDTQNKPPFLGTYFLKKIYDSALYDDIAGDFQEVFEDRILSEGIWMARLKYNRDAILSFRNMDLKREKIKKRSNHLGMIQNYFTMAFRVLRKNPSTSLISILGLAAAIGCTITSFLFADFMGNLDSFHTNRDNVYQVISHVNEEGIDVLNGPSPLILAEHLSEDYTDVLATTRIKYDGGNVRFGQQVFQERLMFVDPDFLKMFDFPLEKGDVHALDQKENVMLSAEMVTKYFGYTDPLGKKVSIKLSNNDVRSFYVSGVFAKTPRNATFKTHIVLPISNFIDLAVQPKSWSSMTNATFVQLQENANPGVLTGLMDNYLKAQNKANPSQHVESFDLIALAGLGNRAEELYRPVAIGNSKSGTFGIAFVGILILILACLNYLNIAVSSGARRLKEIAIRKVMGSSRQNLVYQFLTENLVVCGFSVVFGSLLCYYIFLPGFNMIVPMNVPFAFSTPMITMGFYIGLWLFIALLSGAYPAFYISRHQPAVIFRGSQKFTDKNYFSRTLLTLQLIVSFTTIVGSFVFTDNAMFVKTLSWGYDPEHVISIKVTDAQQFETLKNIAVGHQGIIGSGGSNGHIGVSNPFKNFDYLDKQFRLIAYDVTPDYLQTMKAELLSGRFFDSDKEVTAANSIIVNQDFVEHMGWEAGLGMQVVFEEKRRNVVGVVKNMLHEAIAADVSRPMLFTCDQLGNYEFVTLRYKTGHFEEVDQLMMSSFNQLAPDDPYNRVDQDEIFNRFYENVDANAALMLTISIMAILLSCLGLYGLFVFGIQRRVKEFGIRMVLGAESSNIMGLAIKEYASIIAIAFLIGVPTGSWLIQSTVEDLFVVSKPLSAITIVIAIGVTALALGLTIIREVIKTTKINPTETLRD